jgi:hypothetical protein
MPVKHNCGKSNAGVRKTNAYTPNRTPGKSKTPGKNKIKGTQQQAFLFPLRAADCELQAG